jgi:hypothetical protein
VHRLGRCAAALARSAAARAGPLPCPPAPVPLPALVAPEVSALPVELALGAGALAIGIFGSGATAAFGTACLPAAPSLPAALGASAGGGGGGLVIVTVKVERTFSVTWVVKSGAKARIRPRMTATCSSATRTTTPSLVRGGGSGL